MSVQNINKLCAIQSAIEAQPGKSCTDPVYVTSCDPPVPVIAVEVEIVCNPETDLQEYHIFTSVDGVLGDPTVVTTDVACDAEPIDFEQVRVCDQVTGTYHILTSGFDNDGTAVVMGDLDTGQPCGEDAVPECVKWSATYVQLDNTGTRFNESHEITLTNSDGTTAVLNIAAQAGWSQQITEWAAQLDAAYGGTFDPRCTFLPNGCGGLLPPPADAPPQKGIFARYVLGVFCPTDKTIPVAAEITDSSNPARIGRKLVLYMTEGPEYRGQICRTCDDGAGELQYEDGTPVPAADLPVCYFSCSETIPAAPSAACEFDALEAGCDNVGEPDDNANWVTVTRIVAICEGVISVDYYVPDPADPTALIDYELVGQYVDCETGEPIPQPEADCSKPTIVPCPDPCTNGSTYINGRPPASNAWEWGPYSAPNLNDFEAALEAAGYTVQRFGDKHQVCPPFGAFGEDPDALVLNGIGDGSAAVVEPNIDPDFVAVDRCAELTTGKNDDRRDDKLDSLIEAQNTTNELLAQLIECLCGPCDGDAPPEGSELECAVGKSGLGITSSAVGQIENTDVWAGSIDTSAGWVITDITVTDSAGAAHTLGVNAGDTATGLASGGTTSVTVSGYVDNTRADGTVFRCTVTDRAISANVVVL